MACGLTHIHVSSRRTARLPLLTACSKQLTVTVGQYGSRTSGVARPLPLRVFLSPRDITFSSPAQPHAASHRNVPAPIP